MSLNPLNLYPPDSWPEVAYDDNMQTEALKVVIRQRFAKLTQRYTQRDLPGALGIRKSGPVLVRYIKEMDLGDFIYGKLPDTKWSKRAAYWGPRHLKNLPAGILPYVEPPPEARRKRPERFTPLPDDGEPHILIIDLGMGPERLNLETMTREELYTALRKSGTLSDKYRSITVAQEKQVTSYGKRTDDVVVGYKDHLSATEKVAKELSAGMDALSAILAQGKLNLGVAERLQQASKSPEPEPAKE